MILTTYTKEIFRSKCMPGAQSLHCYAHLKEDVGAVLPFLKAEFGADAFSLDPPTITFKIYGKLITIHSKKIAINALRDEDEADKILTWLQNEINEIWERRQEIVPCFDKVKRPTVVDILRLLPKTNCHKCNEPTCMVFATRLAEGAKDAGDCPELEPEMLSKLQAHLKKFNL